MSSGEQMTYAILLDDYNDDPGDSQYHVTASGTLAECKATTMHDYHHVSWLKSDYVEGPSEPIALVGPKGGVKKGRIVKLTAVAGGD